MKLEFVNTSTESVKVFLNKNKTLLLEPLSKNSVNISDLEPSFSISANDNSKYGALSKRTELIVLSSYELNKTTETATMTIIRQECENESYTKYIRFTVLEDSFFNNITYSIIDVDIVKKKEKKEVILGTFLSIFSEIFSYVNLMFIAIGFAFGKAFGLKTGILVYLIVFGVYSTILELIDAYKDRNKSIANFMTDSYIQKVFHEVQNPK